jgi:mRNA interferase YafQ
MRMTERKAVYSGSYKRDYKRIRHDSAVLEPLREILGILIHGGELPIWAHDHALAGDWRGYRECHVKPDLLLVYKIQSQEGQDKLMLARLRNHGSLFG